MRRKISGITALIFAVALVAVLPRFGFTQVGAALWSERPATSGASAPAASPWVELARTLKPAVVNISTKRVDKSTSPSSSSSAAGRAVRCGASARASSSTPTD